MKHKLPITLALLFILASCQDVDTPVPRDTSKADIATTLSSRSLDEAIEIALNAAATFDNARARGNGRSASAGGVKVVVDSRSRAVAADSLIYVVNFDDNQGFALVPVPRTEKEILAVTDEGSYDPAIGTDNPGFNLYLEAANDYIRYQAANGGIENPDLRPSIKYITYVDTIAQYGKFQRLGEMAWGELTPYNRFTPNGYAGCAPVAMGMIIVNKGAPGTRLRYTFPERDVEYEDINWTSLLYHKRNSPGSLETNHICYSPDKEATHKSIARLIREIGQIAESQYKVRSTITDNNKLEVTLKHFLPNQVVTPLTTFRANSSPEMDILNWGFLLMTANHSNEPYTWVAEGYHYAKTRHRVYEYDPYTLTSTFHSESIKIYSACYFNWGWNGMQNGYYEGVVFTPYDGFDLHSVKYIGVCNAH